MVGQFFWDTPWWRHDKELRQWLRDSIKKAAQGEVIQRGITHCSSKDELHYFDFSLKPVVDENGKALYLIPESRDITEHVKTKEELLQANLIVENSPAVLFRWNAAENWQVEHVSKNVQQFGYNPESLLSGEISYASLIHPDDIERVKQEVKKYSANGLVDFQQEYRILTSTGEERWTEDHTRVERDTDGNITHYQGVIIDITERKKSEKALLSKEHEQREILSFMTEAVISIDQTGKVLTFNKAAEKLFEYKSSEIIGQNVNQLMPERYANKHDKYIQHYLKTGKSKIIGVGREIEGLRKNKNIFSMRIEVAELPASADGTRRFIGSCHDLTRRKQQEEQIRRSQKMDALGKLTGGIAHDYNNMLGVVMGYAKILEEKLDNNPKLANYAYEIHHAGERGAKLTRKLLSFSRHIASDEELLNINELLINQKLMLEKTLTPRIKLILDLEDNLWPVWLDDGDLEDAVLNLSINAMHAIEADGKLIIKTSNEVLSADETMHLQLDEGDYVVLSITDTGCGMNEETKAKIFEPFYSTKGEKGTGLGLSQVYGFVERSGGMILVNSAPGQGTSFKMYFPRHLGNNNITQATNDETAKDYSGNETILIVDDESSLLF